MFEEAVRLVKDRIAAFFEVTPRTIDNYLNKYESELRQNQIETDFKVKVEAEFNNMINRIVDKRSDCHASD